MQDLDDVTEEQAIIDAIADECAAFLERDFDRWASHWLHHEDTRRMGTLSGGQVNYRHGWNLEAAMMARIMCEHPEPNFAAHALVRRENMSVRVSGNMAWASFDQHAPLTDDVFVVGGLSHQVRIFEKHEGRWKIVFAGHGDTRNEYVTFPSIRVDQTAVIQWMNDAAKTGLSDHPVLLLSGGHLRARTRKDDVILRKALADVADLTPMDIRLSVAAQDVTRTAIPLIFEGRESDRLHIVWVASSDGMILVTFDDQPTRDQRLATARNVFGLSNAQFRLAAIIVAGHDLPQAADHMGISVNTARTHLQRMFDKTHVHSQTALVRVLLSAAAPAV